MERMTKGNKAHLEGAKAYGPQDYEVVDEMKILEEENKRLENENIRLKSDIDAMLQNERGYKYDINKLEEENKNLKEEISSLRIELEQEKGKTGKKWTPATPYI